jgi:hypothetical protein
MFSSTSLKEAKRCGYVLDILGIFSNEIQCN